MGTATITRLTKWFIKRTQSGLVLCGKMYDVSGSMEVICHNPVLIGDPAGMITAETDEGIYIFWIYDAKVEKFDLDGFEIVPWHCMKKMQQFFISRQ